MNSTQLEKAGEKIPNFIGVFSVDNIPKIKNKPPQKFIVNNQTSNLPGQHWIGVTILSGNVAYVYDPFGLPPPRMLVYNLQRNMGIKNVVYNKKQVQKLSEQICGPLVLQHLINKTA